MKRILIAGAGPTGLTAALELVRRGIACRIVDRKPRPSTLSRAVGINPRSLDLLEPSGVTAELLAHGFKMRRACFRDGRGRLIGEIRADLIAHRYNFLLALPQDKTETIMQQRLASYGTHVDYGIEVASVALQGGRAEVTLRQNEALHQEVYDLVIAADGVHSRVRERLAIPFPGYDYDNLWSVTDFESPDLPYAEDAAHAFLHDSGHMGLVIKIGAGRYRGVSSTEHALACIPGDYAMMKILNEGTFHIGVRQAQTYQKGCVYLAGDAAHVHSPAGGRGMNLGIEDAADLARRIHAGGLEDYTAMRHPVGKQTLALTETLMRMILLRNPLAKALRNGLIRLATAVPALQKPFLNRLAGLE